MTKNQKVEIGFCIMAAAGALVSLVGEIGVAIVRNKKS